MTPWLSQILSIPLSLWSQAVMTTTVTVKNCYGDSSPFGVSHNLYPQLVRHCSMSQLLDQTSLSHVVFSLLQDYKSQLILSPFFVFPVNSHMRSSLLPLCLFFPLTLWKTGLHRLLNILSHCNVYAFDATDANCFFMYLCLYQGLLTGY